MQLQHESPNSLQKSTKMPLNFQGINYTSKWASKMYLSSSSPHKRVKIPRPYLHSRGTANRLITEFKVDLIKRLV